MVVDPDPNGTDVNAFYYVSGSGATVGDALNISRAQSLSTNSLAIGGLTFQAVPEPASLGLIALAGITLAARRRAVQA